MGETRLAGVWSAQVAKHHINVLELWAIHVAVHQLISRDKGNHILVQCNNMSVVSRINKQGGTRSPTLCLQTIKVLCWCHRHQITLSAVHLPGEDNVLADTFSRKTSGKLGPSKVRGSSAEWHLNPIVCRTIFNRLEHPHIDLCVQRQQSADNILLMGSGPSSSSPGCDDDVVGQHLSVCISSHCSHSMSPSLNGHLQEFQNYLDMPKLASPAMVPDDASCNSTILLPMRKDLITMLDNFLPMDNLCVINWTAWPISSNPTEQWAFQTVLPDWLERQGDHLPERLNIRLSNYRE